MTETSIFKIMGDSVTTCIRYGLSVGRAGARGGVGFGVGFTHWRRDGNRLGANEYIVNYHQKYTMKSKFTIFFSYGSIHPHRIF